MTDHKTGTLAQAELIIKYCIDNKIDVAHELLATVYEFKDNSRQNPSGSCRKTAMS